MLHTLTSCLTVVLLTSSLAHAEPSPEQVVPWTDAAFHADVPLPYGPTDLSVRVDAAGRLATLAVTSALGPLSFPVAATRDINALDVAGIRIVFKRSFDDSTWLFVHLPFGAPIKIRGGFERAVTIIAFRGNRAVYRGLRTPLHDGGYDWQPVDLPQE